MATACASDGYLTVQRSLERGREQEALTKARQLARGSAEWDLRGLHSLLSAKLSMERQRQAQRAVVDGDSEQASRLADEALRFHAGNLSSRPLSADLHSQHATERFAVADYVGAETAWRRALEVLPNHAPALAGLPLALKNRSCQEYEVAQKQFARNDKRGFREATRLFRSIERRTPGLLGAAALASQSEQRRAERLLAEACHLLLRADPPEPAVAHMLANEASRIDSSPMTSLMARLSRDLLRNQSSLHLAAVVEARPDIALPLTGHLNAQLASLGRRRVVDVGDTAAFKRRWTAKLAAINAQRRSAGASEDVVAPCPLVTIRVRVQAPEFQVREGAPRKRKSKYLHGQKSVSNPRIPELQDELVKLNAELLLHLATKKKREDAIDNIDNWLLRIAAEAALTEIIGSVETTQNEIKRKQGELLKEPAKILVKDIREYAYQERDISKECRLRVELTVIDPLGRLSERANPLLVTSVRSDLRRSAVHADDTSDLENKDEQLPSDRLMLAAAMPELEERVYRGLRQQIAAWHGAWGAGNDLESFCRELFLDESDLIDLPAGRESAAKAAWAKAVQQPLAPDDAYPAAAPLSFPVAPFELELPREALAFASRS